MSSNGIYSTEAEVLAAVQAELSDPKFAHREHGKLKTYNDGCQGPLCRKKMRDYGREQYRAKNGVPAHEHHRPTVRTKWDALLSTQPTRQVEVAA